MQTFTQFCRAPVNNVIKKTKKKNNKKANIFLLFAAITQGKYNNIFRINFLLQQIFII